MKELVEVIAKALVDNPDEVAVTESVKDDEIVVELTVASSDMGKVIGKQGRIAKAIRSVVKAAASKEDKKVIGRDSSNEEAAGLHGRRLLLFQKMETTMEQFLRVGVITSPHGIRGEVKVFPTTDDINRFKKLKEVYLDTGKERLSLRVEQAKFFKGMAILKFREFNSINEVEPFRKKDLLVSREHAVQLAPNENFIVDLIGLAVVTDEGEEFGTVKDILQTGANDVYVITGKDGKEYLFPSIKECILDVDLDKGQVLVHILDGLLDL